MSYRNAKFSLSKSSRKWKDTGSNRTMYHIKKNKITGKWRRIFGNNSTQITKNGNGLRS
jgi:hypothetical protein